MPRGPNLWLLVGLALQVQSVVPLLYAAFQPMFSIVSGEGATPDLGDIVDIDTRVRPAQWIPTLIAFAMVGLGALCQAVGVLRGP